MTALEFVRQAARVKAIRLHAGNLDEATDWLAAHGVIAYSFGDRLLLCDADGASVPARVGQWVALELETGFIEVCDGDDERPDGHWPGLGIAQ